MTIDTPAWVRDAVFYQIFPDRFASSARVVKPGALEPWASPPTIHGFKGGDLLGVVERLDYLEALGITAIWFNPVFQSASNHRYHTYDYLAVDPLLGGDAALRELIDACHERGIRVVLDGVFNHASRGFWPFNHLLEVGPDSPYRDWFYLSEAFLDGRARLRAFEPAVELGFDTAAVSERQRLGIESLDALGYRAWWDLPALPKLNVDNPHVREYLLGVAEHWLRFGADGWRLDVPEEIDPAFWREFRQRVKAVDPDAYIVAEIWHEKPEHLGGDMYDALMNYQLGTAILSFVGAGHLDRRVLGQQFTLDAAVQDADGPAFARRLDQLHSIYDPAVTAVQLNLLGSHDTPRVLSMVGGDVASVRLATVIQMTLTGAPCVYYGDEIGMRGEQDPLSRGAFPWDDPQSWDQSLLEFVRGATAVRHANPVLRHGRFRVLAAEDRAIADLRDGDDASTSDGAIVVVVNAGEAGTTLTLDLPELEGRVLQRLFPEPATGAPAFGPVTDGRVIVELAGRDACVLRAAAG